MIHRMQARLLQNAMIAVFLLFLRLEAGRPAVATATVTAGLVSGVVLVDGGDGYLSAPSVAFVGGGGTGASAVAILNGNAVGAIVVTTAGGGYTSAPSVVIGGPPPAIDPANLQIDTIPRLTIAGMQGTTNAVQWIDSLTPPGQWNLLTNVILGGSPAVILDTTAPTGARRFYRVVTTNGEPPGRPPGFVWIPAGRFLMGSPPAEDGRQEMWEAQHPVVISRGFWISSTETTAGQYGEVTKRNPAGQTDRRAAVISVTWRDATNYCHILTQAERDAGRLPLGYVYRLPTEAEWEYATRAGSTTRFSFGESHTNISQFAWIFLPGERNTAQPVGQLRANPWGLFDVHGNAAEWCLDAGVYPYPLWEVVDPLASGTDWRVVRGGHNGAGSQTLDWLRSAKRWALDGRSLQNEGGFVGFRTVLGPPVVVTEPN
jgi:formylglycine-generating enzyme required for sulfatase activity